jgi:glycosyltransferase involved in cell wall biosynthesis
MKKKYKIAIFSGSIPSATFIENVIEGIAPYHEVKLFGVITKKKNYANKNIKIYPTPSSHILNAFVTCYRCLLLLFRNPRSIPVIYKEAASYPTLYEKWIWFSKFIPIVLYKPDIIHMQWARDILFYSFLKEKLNFNIVLSLLGSHINYSPITDKHLAEVYTRVFPKIDKFQAVSHAIAKETQIYGAEPSRITVIRSVLSKEIFSSFKKRERNIDGPIKILSIGRHHWVKGYSYAVDAMQILELNHFDFEYTIIAGGNTPEHILFQVNDLDLVSKIKFLDHIDQEALFTKMQDYDVLLLPSLNEGIANVVLEAMAIGLPVISTDCGGMAEVVKHKETGWLVPVRDPEAMAQAIIDVTKTSEKDLQKITQQAHDFVKTHFNAEDSIQQFLELYESVVGHGS